MNDAKYAAELKFWREEFDRYVDWYRGNIPELYGILKPTNAERITRHDDVRRCALETWINADRWRYCWHLFVEPTYFAGKDVLEIGPGPLGLARWFMGANVHATEPLLGEFMEIGYPMVDHSIFYKAYHAEFMEDGFDDNTFDAAFSVNAIDHVDNFEEAAAEMERVVKPGGEIRIETHYHASTTTEPCVLTDERVRAAFKKFPMQKISNVSSSYFYPRGTHPDADRLVLWSNVADVYPAREVLR